jgi:hypothetical protein
MEFAIIALASLASFGFHIATDYLMLHVWGKGWDDVWPDLNAWERTLIKPIAACPPCMGSVHGTFWHFYLGGEFYLWPVTVLSVVTCNWLLNKLK